MLRMSALSQTSMRGIVRTARRRVEVIDLPIPKPEPGTAIVRVLASGICGSDLHPFRESDGREERPSGHEVAGEVVAVSPHPGTTSHVREGDLVAIDTICLGRACGECRWCREGSFFHCEAKRGQSEWAGAFAQYIKRDVRGLFPLPAGVTPTEGAMVEPLAVGVHALRLAGMREGETVAVIGAGTIGLTTVMAAVALGAGRVFALAKHPHQAEAARQFGAEAISPDGTVELIKAATAGAGADLVVETVGGVAPTLDQAVALVRRRGRVAVLGLFSHPMPFDVGKVLSKEATIHFPVCYGTLDGRHDYDVTLDLIASGKAPARRLLTHTFPLDQAQQAFDTAADKESRSIKVHFAF